MEADQIPRVLVVDDSAPVRRMVRSMFEKARFDVVCASSGEEALELALGQPFDAIVTDLTMDDLSGVQLCRILNSDPATSDVPVVMLTATDTPYSRFCARHAGADHYVTKNDARETLVSVVETLVDRDAPRSARDTDLDGLRSDPIGRLSRVLEEHLFLTLVSSEIRGFARHTEDRHALATEVLRLCGEVLDHAYAVLELCGPEGRSLTVHARGPWPDDVEEGLRALGIDVSDTSTVERIGSHDVTGPVVSTESQRYPIEAGGEPLGSLAIFGGRAGLSDRSKMLAAHVAAELAVVAQSLALFEKMRQMAETDPLTQLANRRRCRERLEHELARARRTGRPLCLLLCDVDHFKAVNDTHGHNAGDHVLRTLAAELEDRVRTVDLVGRWGGEEFVLILPEAPLEGGRLVAERLRRAIEALSFEEPVGGITISTGVVECDPDLSIETLLQRADECLYEAKEGGRNKVIVCDATGERR